MKLFIVHVSVGPWPVDRCDSLIGFDNKDDADSYAAEREQVDEDTCANVYAVGPGDTVEM